MVAASKTIRRVVMWPTALGLCLSLAGCNMLKQHDDNFTDDYATWGQAHRPHDDSDGNLTGASEKARQVERNLGVR